MADIQAALSAKFMQVAGASKGNSSTGLLVDAQLASFIGVLKSQMTEQDMPTAVLTSTLLAGGAKKSALPQLEADLTAANDISATASQVDPAQLPAAAIAAVSANGGTSTQADSSSQDADAETALNLQDAAVAKDVRLGAKTGAKPMVDRAAIAAVGGQGLPPDGAAQDGVAQAVQGASSELVGEAALPTSLTSLTAVRAEAGIGTANSAPVSPAHPFEQVLRQAEARINAAIDAPVRSPAFANELSDKVVWLATRQGQFADLSLNPAQMGTVEVRLTLSGGDASAQFYSPNPAVRDAIDAALPRLRELMSQAGINLGEAGVREQAFGHREQLDQREHLGSRDDDMPMQQVAMADAARHRTTGLGLVDLYI